MSEYQDDYVDGLLERIEELEEDFEKAKSLSAEYASHWDQACCVATERQERIQELENCLDEILSSVELGAVIGGRAHRILFPFKP